MDSLVAVKMLNTLGRKLAGFYGMLFAKSTEIKLVMEDYTFFSICAGCECEGCSFDPESVKSAFDAVGIRYSRYSGSNSDVNFFIALSICVYQSLVANRVAIDDSGDTDHRIWDKFKEVMPSLRQNLAFDEYKGQTPFMWEFLQMEFPEKMGKRIHIPDRRTGAFSIVQYPRSQKIFEAGELRNIRNSFQGIEDESVDIEAFRNLRCFQKYRFDDLKINIIYSFYQSWLSWYSSAGTVFCNDGSEGSNLDEAVYYDPEKSLLFHEYCGGILDAGKVGSYCGLPFYYDEALMVFTPERQETPGLVGFFAGPGELGRYGNKVIPMKCQNDGISFLCFEWDEIADDIAISGIFQSRRKTVRDCTLKKGICLDGRSNIYDCKHPPEIHFDHPPECVRISNGLDSESVMLTDKVLYLDSLSIRIQLLGEIKVSWFYDGNGGNERSIILTFIRIPLNNPEPAVTGWNLKNLAPAETPDESCVISLRYNPCNTVVPKGKVLVRPAAVKKAKAFTPVEYDLESRNFLYDGCFIDCALYGDGGGNLPPESGNRFSALLKGWLNEKLSMFQVMRLNELMAHVFEKMGISEHLPYPHFLAYYRLLKKCVTETCCGTKDFTIVIYYSRKNGKLTPFISKIEYAGQVYGFPAPYFESFRLNGKRPGTDSGKNRFLFGLDGWDGDYDLEGCLKLLCRHVNFSWTLSRKCREDFLEYTAFFAGPDYVLDWKNKTTGCYCFEINLNDMAVSQDKGAVRISFDEDVKEKPFGERSNPFEPEFKMQSITDPGQRMFLGKLTELYAYVKGRGIVSWRDITVFCRENLEEKSAYPVFFPLYEMGMIEICRTGSGKGLGYFAPDFSISVDMAGAGKITLRPKLKTRTGFCGIITEISGSAPESGCNEKRRQTVLKILKNIPPLEDIIKSWTKVTRKAGNFRYVWDFGNHEDRHPGFVRLKENVSDFRGICRMDKARFSYEPSYFRMGTGDFYQIPLRNVNPDAERIAKCVMRAELGIADRMEYDSESRIFTCRVSDLPLPVLRALSILDPLKIEWSLYNKKNDVSYTNVDAGIFSEIERIFSSKVIRMH